MSLSEEQIVRYSRQLLLGPVGGKGQEQLLAQGARVSGEGQCIATAGAYLAAGGTPVWPLGGEVGPAQPGFLFGADAVGLPAPRAWAEAVSALNADAARSMRVAGQVSELPAVFEGDAPWVALGASGEGGVCVLRGEHGCVECFRDWTKSVGSPPSGALAVVLGAFGALVFQHAVLGLEPAGLRRWHLAPDGALDGAAQEGEPCPHRR